MPTNFTPNDSTSGENFYRVLVTNSGGAPSSGTITLTDTLPVGLSLDPAGLSGVEQIDGTPLTCAGPECTYSESVPPGDSLELTVPVDTGAESSAETNLIEVSGGVAPAASQATPTQISSAPAGFGIAPGSSHTALSTDQAGAHADLTTTVAFNTINHEGSLAGDPKDTTDNLPPGFAGDLTDMPACAVAYFSAHDECPVSDQVGSATVMLHGLPDHQVMTPVYNLAPNPGTTAKLAFNVFAFNVQGDVSVRPGDQGLQTTFHDTSASAAEIDAVSLAIWGVPGDPSHDALRGTYCDSAGGCNHVGGSPSGTVTPFLTTPTSCSGQVLEAEFRSSSWQQPATEVTEQMPFGPLSGCQHLAMQPSISAEPTTTNAYSATGLDVGLEIPQTFENPHGLTTSHLKQAVVTLPAGMSLNPSAGAGLGFCTEAQLASETAESVQGEGCPNDAKVGTVRVKSPAIPEEASGALYVAKPFVNPFHSLLALYIVAKIPDRGIIVRSAGEVHPDPVTGQLTTTFPENPQLPFSDFTLSFRQGQTSPLITPPACGQYTVDGQLTPWSNLLTTDPVSATFSVSHGVNGGPCPSGGVPPFHPELHAGTTSNAAGHYSPFYIRISRQDGEQEITHFSIKLPPGVIGKLAGVSQCSDAAIAAAKAREHDGGGAEEQAAPSCPATSEVGHTLVEAGVGSVLAQAPGKVYLAGPYHGSAISVVAITAARVGPFDLGTVVVREALRVNPETGEVFVDSTGSDPLPHIIQGIPTHLRTIRIYMDRPEFVLNPTSCEPTSTASTVLGSGLDFVSAADDVPFVATSPFQAADCAALPFRPKLTLKLKGSTKRGGNPALHAHLAMHGIGEAGLAYAQTSLPPTEFLDNAHIGTVCTRVVFKEGAVEGEKCPPGSLIGHAKAVTPLLSEPLEGPIYLRSNPERELPDIAAALHAQEINVVAVGHTESAKGGGLRNTFEVVPDAPITSVDIDLFGGKRGLLENAPPGNANSICQAKTHATVKLRGHNGKQLDSRVPLQATGCKKHKKSKRHHR
jgi:uncharacterized repeat protein (TIGR01451 family)